MSTKENGSPPGPDPAPPQFPTREEVLRKFDPANSGRDAHGRFAPGNAGGPGNPYARQVAALRKEVAQFLAEGRLRPLAERLYELSMGGDVRAAKLLLSYGLGRPAAAVEPDDLEAHELGVFRRATAREGDALSVEAVPAGAFNEFAARVRPIRAEAHARETAREWRWLCREHDAYQAACAEQARAAAAAKAPAGPARPITAEEVSELLRHPALAALTRPAESRDESRRSGPSADSKRAESGRGGNGRRDGGAANGR